MPVLTGVVALADSNSQKVSRCVPLKQLCVHMVARMQASDNSIIAGSACSRHGGCAAILHRAHMRLGKQ